MRQEDLRGPLLETEEAEEMKRVERMMGVEEWE